MMIGITSTGIVEGVIGGVISMFLIVVVLRIWKLELTLHKKLGIYAFITAASFFAVMGLFFSITYFSQAGWLLGTVILVLLALWYGFSASPFSLGGLKRIRLYIKGYRFSELKPDEIFKWYGGCNNFIGKNDFYIPYKEVFRNDEGLKEEDFLVKMEQDDNGHHKRYRLSSYLDEDIIKDVQTFHAVQDRCWDGITARISRIDTNKKSEVTIYFEETRYYDYLVSNLYIDTFIPSLNMTLRKVLEPMGYKDAWEKPRSANHGGVTALLLCSDKQLILLRNRKDNATYPNEICASTSGTLEFRDVKKGANQSPPFEALRREMDEELHLSPTDLKELRLLAITRDMTRGGIPEFIFFAETDLSSIDVRVKFRDPYKFNHIKRQEIKPIDKGGFDTEKIDKLCYSSDLETRQFNFPAMAAVYYYEEMVYHELMERN